MTGIKTLNDSGVRRLLLWTVVFAAFFLIERIVPSSTGALIWGSLILFFFAVFDVSRNRTRINATLHWIAFVSTVMAYVMILAFSLSAIAFSAEPTVVTSLAEFGSELGKAVMMYVGHCIAFAVFTVLGFVAAVSYRLTNDTGWLLVASNAPCLLLTTYLGVHHLLHGI